MLFRGIASLRPDRLVTRLGELATNREVWPGAPWGRSGSAY